jgi:hypothetical protein
MKNPVLLGLAAMLGAAGVLIGGALLGVALCDLSGNGAIEGPPRWMWMWFIPCPILLLFGTRQLHQPLRVLVFISPPVLLAAGLCLCMAYPDRWLGRIVLCLGVIIPLVLSVFVNAHYRGRENKP